MYDSLTFSWMPLANVPPVQCIYGSGLRKAIAFSQSQMVLDIVGDALSKLPLSIGLEKDGI